MRMIDGMRTQLLGELVGRGFVRQIEDASTEGHRADLVRAVLVRIKMDFFIFFKLRSLSNYITISIS